MCVCVRARERESNYRAIASRGRSRKKRARVEAARLGRPNKDLSLLSPFPRGARALLRRAPTSALLHVPPPLLACLPCCLLCVLSSIVPSRRQPLLCKRPFDRAAQRVPTALDENARANFASVGRPQAHESFAEGTVRRCRLAPGCSRRSQRCVARGAQPGRSGATVQCAVQRHSGESASSESASPQHPHLARFRFIARAVDAKARSPQASRHRIRTAEAHVRHLYRCSPPRPRDAARHCRPRAARESC